VSAGAPTTRLIGRYAIYQAIASGGMATVYLGRLLGPVGFARTVAIKRLHEQYASEPKFVAMFLDEARLAARVRHPNVVPTLDVVATDGELFLVMEYVHGESLGRLVRAAVDQGTPIPVPIVVSIMSGVLQGLHAAHEAKSEKGVPLHIIHRDVSPQNILLGRDGQARLLDFGVARAEERLHKTQEGLVKGKLAYMAPEQLRAETLGPPTDIYAAAVVMWEALAGRRLFPGTSEGGLVVEVLEGKVERPSDVLREAGDTARADEVLHLDDLLMRALALKSEARWQTARELARELETAVAPATASQVSDWVESAAGSTLRERASMVAEIESSSAVELTQGDLGAAIAQTTPGEARNDWPMSTAPTIPDRRPSTVPPPKTAPMPDAEAAPHTRAMSTVPDPSHPGPATTSDPQPETLPLVTAKDASRAPSAPVNTSPLPPIVPITPAPLMPGPPLAQANAPPGPLPGTLVSVPSPVAGKDVRGIPKFAETMQSMPSPVKTVPPPRENPVAMATPAPAAPTKPPEKAKPAASPKKAAQAEPAPPSEAVTLPVRSRSGALIVAVLVVAAGVAGIAYALSQPGGAHEGVKPMDTSGAATPTTPRSGLDPEPSARPAER
jgi:serine/threonine protein kinase